MNTVSSERSNLILQRYVLIHGCKNQAFDQTKSNHSKTGKEITRTATEGLLSNLLLNERKHRNQEGHAQLGAQERAQLGASTHGADALSAGLRLGEQRTNSPRASTLLCWFARGRNTGDRRTQRSHRSALCLTRLQGHGGGALKAATEASAGHC